MKRKNTFTQKKRNSRGFVKPSFVISRFRAPKNYGQPIKTLDCNYTGNPNPYIADVVDPQQIPISTSGIIQNIATIQQGAGISQRIGNKISLKSLRIRFDIAPTLQSVEVNSSARLMVIYDRNPNGAYPLITNMLANNKQDGTTGNGIMWSSVNCNLMDRFVVLMDEFVVLPPITNGGVNGNFLTGPTSEKSFKIDRYIKLKGLETVFSGTASPLTIANVQVGALYLVSWGNVALATAPYTWVGTTRLRFRDN